MFFENVNCLKMLQFQIVLNDFYDESSLTNITIPNSITEIGRSAFEECSSLTKITNSVIKIGRFAFKKCISLTNIILNSVIEIDCSAFLECSSITNVIEINERNVLFGETIQNSLIENW